MVAKLHFSQAYFQLIEVWRKPNKVILYNRDPDLTLRPRRRSITEALEHVEHGDEGSRDGVHIDWKSLRIDQHHFFIEVEERKKDWHATIGCQLANRYGMRRFCDKNNPSQMFFWDPIT